MTAHSRASERRRASLTFFVSPDERRLITRALRVIDPGRTDALLRALGLTGSARERVTDRDPARLRR